MFINSKAITDGQNNHRTDIFQIEAKEIIFSTKYFRLKDGWTERYLELKSSLAIKIKQGK